MSKFQIHFTWPDTVTGEGIGFHNHMAARIFVQIDDTLYPDAAWLDNVIPMVDDWVREAMGLEDGKESVFWFFEGPFCLKVTPQSDALEIVERNDAFRFWVSKVAFIDEIIRCALRLRGYVDTVAIEPEYRRKSFRNIDTQ